MILKAYFACLAILLPLLSKSQANEEIVKSYEIRLNSGHVTEAGEILRKELAEMSGYEVKSMSSHTILKVPLHPFKTLPPEDFLQITIVFKKTSVWVRFRTIFFFTFSRITSIV